MFRKYQNLAFPQVDSDIPPVSKQLRPTLILTSLPSRAEMSVWKCFIPDRNSRGRKRKKSKSIQAFAGSASTMTNQGFYTQNCQRELRLSNKIPISSN